MNYNPNYIIAAVERMYSQAESLVILYGLLGLMIGAYFGHTISNQLALAGLILGLVIGAFIGATSAERLRLNAQLSLAIAKIEQNTRPAYELTEAPIPAEPLKKSGKS